MRPGAVAAAAALLVLATGTPASASASVADVDRRGRIVAEQAYGIVSWDIDLVTSAERGDSRVAVSIPSRCGPRTVHLRRPGSVIRWRGSMDAACVPRGTWRWTVGDLRDGKQRTYRVVVVKL